MIEDPARRHPSGQAREPALVVQRLSEVRPAGVRVSGLQCRE